MANILLAAKGIKIRFGGVIAADGIDLDVYEGENLAIIGPNGAGKTTFLNISTPSRFRNCSSIRPSWRTC